MITTSTYLKSGSATCQKNVSTVPTYKNTYINARVLEYCVNYVQNRGTRDKRVNKYEIMHVE